MRLGYFLLFIVMALFSWKQTMEEEMIKHTTQTNIFQIRTPRQRNWIKLFVVFSLPILSYLPKTRYLRQVKHHLHSFHISSLSSDEKLCVQLPSLAYINITLRWYISNIYTYSKSWNTLSSSHSYASNFFCIYCSTFW